VTSIDTSPSPRILIIWQSLVVSSYRSFFIHFAKISGLQIGAVAPHAFWELGGQIVKCAPFSEEWKTLIHTDVLETTAYHIQFVWFRGLWRVFKKERDKNKDAPRSYVIAFMEPYSLSALIIVILGYIFLPRSYRFIFYSAQNIKKRFPLPLRLVQTFIFRHARAIMSLSSEVAQVLRKQGFNGEIIPFPLWLDSSVFRILPREVLDPSNSKKIVFAYCGALTPAKGINDILAALQTLSPSELSQIRFEVAGVGPMQQEVEDCLHSLSALGLFSFFHGPLPAERMPEFFNRADVLIVASRTEKHWKEQFGRVIIEAWACGATVIGSNSGEIPKLIRDPDLIFNERDHESLAAVIRRILADPSQIQSRFESAAKASPFLDMEVAQNFFDRLSQLEK
jgi:glycosyltransferase involved in cell wall biosynthesis